MQGQAGLFGPQVHVQCKLKPYSIKLVIILKILDEPWFLSLSQSLTHCRVSVDLPVRQADQGPREGREQ